MKTKQYLITVVILIVTNFISHGQKNAQEYKMEGTHHQKIQVAQTFNKSVEIFPFAKNVSRIYGLDASAKIKLNGDESLVRLILVDNNFNEYLIYESYKLLLEEEASFTINNICEETSILNNVLPYSINIEIKNATLELKSLSFSTSVEQGKNRATVQKLKKKARNEDKIKKINKNLKKYKKNWIAGTTGVSKLSFAERKKLYGQSTFPPGFEYYVGGVISTSTNETFGLKSATSSSPYIDNWDWRDRHGKNWITPVKDQESCGSCWAFSAVGVTEAMVNVFYNQLLNLDLSEQNLISCADAGNCGGGYPRYALDYIVNTGVIDEYAFPYSATVPQCEIFDNNVNQLISFTGKEAFGFGSENYLTYSEDNLKKMLIEMGPLSSALKDWAHAMVLVGYKIVQAGDTFYYRDLNLNRYWITIESGDPIIGKTVWIFKNSWGESSGDNGYVYVETPINNITSTFGLKTPSISLKEDYEVQCTDADGDGYYWWGLGEKPENCPDCPDLADGDDSDATKGPLNEYGFCIPLTGDAPPVAAFTASTTSIEKGKSATFTDQSTNKPTTWNWTFEGGTPQTSSEQNPTVTYTETGNFQVSLSVSNPTGDDTKTIDGYIQVTEPLISPIAAFEADNTVIVEGQEVTFTDKSANTPKSWKWEFEGGTPSTSTLQNPKVKYNSSNNYRVSLTVTNSAGQDQKIIDNYIAVDKEEQSYCYASGGSNSDWIATVQIDAQSKSSSYLGYSDFTDFEFNLGNGTKPRITLSPGFSSRSKFEYWAVWIDFNQDMEFSDTEKVYSSSKSKSTVTGSLNIPSGLDITTRMRVIMNTSAPQTACATYANGEVEDYTVRVSMPAPEANFTASSTNITSGEKIQFTNTSLNNPTSFTWTFTGGDISTSHEENPVVRYSTPGSYEAKLVVSNNIGTSEKKMSITVLEQSDNTVNYCTPVNIVSSTNYIKRVVFGDMDNTTGGDGYQAPRLTINNLEAGKSYPIDLFPFSNKTRNFWRIWIDFNQDNYFDDASELVLIKNGVKGPISSEITLPQDCHGSTRMRIAMKINKVPGACEDNFSGEVEDYTVNLSALYATKSAELNPQNQVDSDFSLRVYPNPTTDFVTLEVSNYEEGDNYSIFNLSGKMIAAKNILSSHSKIDCSDFPQGIYLVRVVNRRQTHTKKIIKKD